jgi:hypothetical protein
MEIVSADGLLTVMLLVFAFIAFILWYRGRKLKKEIQELKRGKSKTSRWHKLLVALSLRKKEKPPHAGFKKGDINIRVYRTCKKKRKR